MVMIINVMTYIHTYYLIYISIHMHNIITYKTFHVYM